MANNELIEKFESLLRSTGREGVENLISFIRKSDFYSAPASTKYHSCHEGGLLEHSLNVYTCLHNLIQSPPWNSLGLKEENLIIVALLHDICKTYYYVTEMKNKKIYSENGSKWDSNGKFDWVSVPGYTVEDQYPYGHGEKSVMMVENFIKLEPVEKYAIRWHMGFTEPKDNWSYLGASMRKYPLVLAVHMADLEATYLLEKEE